MATKHCFMNKDRVCDLTCKAAFAVDDPMDPVDCYFIWLSAHLGEGLGLLEGSLHGPDRVHDRQGELLLADQLLRPLLVGPEAGLDLGLPYLAQACVECSVVKDSPSADPAGGGTHGRGRGCP